MEDNLTNRKALNIVLEGYESIVSSSFKEVILEIVKTMYDYLVKREYGEDMPALARMIINTDCGLEPFLQDSACALPTEILHDVLGFPTRRWI